MKRAADWTGEDVREIVFWLFSMLRYQPPGGAVSLLRFYGIHVEIDADKVAGLASTRAIAAADDLVGWLRLVRGGFKNRKDIEAVLADYGITIRYEET